MKKLSEKVQNIEQNYSEEKREKELMKVAKNLAQTLRKIFEYNKQVEEQKKGKITCQYCGIEFEEGIINPELHHDKLTLAEVIYNIISYDFIAKGETEFTTFDILIKSLDEHIKGNVSFVIICECCHKKIHAARKKLNS